MIQAVYVNSDYIPLVDYRDVKEICINLHTKFRDGKEGYRKWKEILRYGNVSKRKNIRVQQKISGTFRTPQGVDAFCRNRGYISTIMKNIMSEMGSLYETLKGELPKPDLIPIFIAKRIIQYWSSSKSKVLYRKVRIEK